MDVENTNQRQIALAGYNQDYGAKEARLALAIADAGGSGGPSSGSASGTSSSTIATGINSSTDIEAILNELKAINTNTDGIELKLDGTKVSIDRIDVDTSNIETGIDELSEILGETDDVIVDSSATGTLSSRLRAIQANLEGANADTIVDIAFTANATNQIASAANTDTIELYIQNKSLTDNVYIRNNGAASLDLSIMLFPGGSHTYTGIEAQKALNAITSGPDVNIYIKRTNG